MQILLLSAHADMHACGRTISRPYSTRTGPNATDVGVRHNTTHTFVEQTSKSYKNSYDLETFNLH